MDVVGVAAIRLLEAIRNYMKHSGKTIRFYQAGSSEMFGSAKPRGYNTTRNLITIAYLLAGKLSSGLPA